MSRFMFALSPMVLVLACSSGSSSSGTRSPSGSPTPSGSGTCSGVPSNIVSSCSIYVGGDADAGTGGSLEFCSEYSGATASLDLAQQACDAGGPLVGYGIASPSACPTANQVGGACVQNCGGNLAITTYFYTSSGQSASQVADECKSPNVYVQ